jgi:hypothetical protein
MRAAWKGASRDYRHAGLDSSIVRRLDFSLHSTDDVDRRFDLPHNRLSPFDFHDFCSKKRWKWRAFRTA